MSGQSVCRWGVECRRADCWFIHPNGRYIDGGQQQTPNMIPPVPMGMMPMNLPIYTMPLSGVTKPITHAEPAPAASASRKGPNVCRYGRECHRAECWFVHPDGRDIDEDDANKFDGADTAEFDAALDEFEAEAKRDWNNAGRDGAANASTEEDEFNCPCCGNNPVGCTNTPDCTAAGLCVCQMGGAVDDDIAEFADGDESTGDDSWRDEWFPQSRECDCCRGYQFRCRLSQPQCANGKCFCADQAQPQMTNINGNANTNAQTEATAAH